MDVMNIHVAARAPIVTKKNVDYPQLWTQLALLGDFTRYTGETGVRNILVRPILSYRCVPIVSSGELVG